MVQHKRQLDTTTIPILYLIALCLTKTSCRQFHARPNISSPKARLPLDDKQTTHPAFLEERQDAVFADLQARTLSIHLHTCAGPSITAHVRTRSAIQARWRSALRDTISEGT